MCEIGVKTHPPPPPTHTHTAHPHRLLIVPEPAVEKALFFPVELPERFYLIIHIGMGLF